MRLLKQKGKISLRNIPLSSSLLPEKLDLALFGDNLEVLAKYHATNYLSDYLERKDLLFWSVTVLFYEDPEKFRKLRKKMETGGILSTQEVWHALAGYLRYVNGEYKQARDCFIRAIALNPDNIDNWFDLAFSLRHLGDYKNSSVIIFHYNLVQYYYIRNIPGTDRWEELKKLLSKISQVVLKEGR